MCNNIYVVGSMSLVAYGDSDCESDEDDCVTAEVKKPLSGGVQTATESVSSKPCLSLPRPKYTDHSETPDDRDPVEEPCPTTQSAKQPAVVNGIQEIRENIALLLPTLPKPKAGGKIKITIPSLNEVFLTQIVNNSRYNL